MKLYKKFTRYGKYAAACAGLVLTTFNLYSCSDDDEQSQPLATPSVTYQTTYNALSFSWENVPQAIQYGYRLTDAQDNAICGGVTTETSITIEDLQKMSDYTLTVYAYPALDSNFEPSHVDIGIHTPFYTALNFSGTYQSAVIPIGNTWAAEIQEERDEQATNEFGTFTLKAWYGKEGYDLQFTVNANNTIRILNGTADPATGYVTVASGNNNSTVKNGVNIEESRCYFDRDGHTLTIYCHATRGTREGEDIFTWDE